MNTQRPIVTASERARMVALHRRGRPITHIAGELGRGRRTAQEQLARAGQVGRHRPAGLTDDQIDALVTGYTQDSASIRTLATEHGLSANVVRKALLYRGVQLRSRGGNHRREAS